MNDESNTREGREMMTFRFREPVAKLIRQAAQRKQWAQEYFLEVAAIKALESEGINPRVKISAPRKPRLKITLRVK